MTCMTGCDDAIVLHTMRWVSVITSHSREDEIDEVNETGGGTYGAVINNKILI